MEKKREQAGMSTLKRLAAKQPEGSAKCASCGAPVFKGGEMP